MKTRSACRRGRGEVRMDRGPRDSHIRDRRRFGNCLQRLLKGATIPWTPEPHRGRAQVLRDKAGRGEADIRLGHYRR